MLFAILDYINYRRRRGHYSDESIRKEGGRLAAPENFPMLLDLGPRHRFVYHTRDSFLSWLVMYYTASVWSHVGNFTERGHIIDATTAGVIEHPLSDYFDGKSYIIILAAKKGLVSDEQLAKSLEWGRRQIGCGFNWPGLRRFFWSIVFGAHANYRFRVSGDILILLLVLCPLAYLSHTFGVLLLLVSSLYVFIVVMNTTKRRAMRRMLTESGVNLR